ncbi:hypothetical protein KY311_01260 [Candidatus Woesearchaeota archaeon]|nr:hypothetical protein [Candidatus Woesearchaeota archaeon]
MAKILGAEDPKEFRNKRVNISSAKNSIDAKVIGMEMSFPEMMKHRHPVDAKQLKKELGQGHDFANLGVSGVYTTTIDGDDYLLAVRQDRKDFGDCVAKLVSGYVDAKYIDNPLTALEKELSEEVLPVAPDGRLMHFTRDHTRFLPRPFEKEFGNFPHQVNVTQPAKYKVPGLISRPIKLEGNILPDTPGIYYLPAQNSAQLVAGYHLEPSADLRELEVTLNHSEDKLNMDKMVLETHLHPNGVLLFKLNNGELTNQVYTLQKGVLVPVDPRGIMLSEAFAPKKSGVVEVNNIKLEEYLK